MGNAKAIFNSHNKKVLSKKPDTERPCKCNTQYAGVPRICPIPNICNETDVVYAARVTEHENREKSTYYGLTMNPLKNRVSAHLRSFEEGTNQGKTTLSRHVHDIRDRGRGYDVEWSVERRTTHWNGGKDCNLCLAEKTKILFSKENVLNQRKELFSTCRHQQKYKFGKTSQVENEDEENDVFLDCTTEGGDPDEPEEPVQVDSYSQNLFNWLRRQKK